jgi:hypothetical protein
MSVRSSAGRIGQVVEELLGRRLVAVERLSWQTEDGKSSPDVGPLRLVFDDGQGLVVEGGSDWTLNVRITRPHENSWVDAYAYDFGAGRWVLRDAGKEAPFSGAMGGALTGWQPDYNEVQEVVGLRLWFDGHKISLTQSGGEVRT